MKRNKTKPQRPLTPSQNKQTKNQDPNKQNRPMSSLLILDQIQTFLSTINVF